ncbi:MAG: hypothetical protein GXP40_02430 [Chloroflexi bacterium]|nr:hypothetical protein [Chloroflexota bacterium]
MSEKPSSSQAESSSRRFPTEIVVALLSLIGVGLTAYFSYLQTRAPLEISLQATQTAEARATRLALSATSTKKPVVHTSTPTLTQTPTKSKTPTPSATPTVAGRPDGLRYCVNAFIVNVRVGPSTQYGVVGNLTSDDCLYFDASNEDGTWLRISSNQPEKYEEFEEAWLYRELLGLSGGVVLPAVTLTPTSTPTPSLTPTPTLTSTPTPLG